MCAYVDVCTCMDVRVYTCGYMSICIYLFDQVAKHGVNGQRKICSKARSGFKQRFQVARFIQFQDEIGI
eukprot:m.256505 g.256505  ORF g.256505 m.256505 type:complete len:69 (+) comp34416_c0_seq1:108-314(+)